MSETATTGPVFEGVLAENKSEMIVLTLPGTDYRLHLAVSKPINASLNERVEGTIHARAKRVDVVPSGGRFIEPVYGRPRRVQGRIISTDTATNSITVKSACPLVCELTVGQRAADFHEGQLVGFDVERGARFELTHVRGGGWNGTVNPNNPTPPGRAPTEGEQLTAGENEPNKTKDHGPLSDQQDISGRLKPTGEQPLNGGK